MRAGSTGASGTAAWSRRRREGKGIVFSVETTTRDGMHEVVTIKEVTEAGVTDVSGLSESVMAEMRTTVRGHLDMLGHERGPALTEVEMSQGGTRIRNCRVTGT